MLQYEKDMRVVYFFYLFCNMIGLQKKEADMTVDEKIRGILKSMKEYEPLQDYFKVVVSVYGCEMVVNLKPFDWEFYGENLEVVLDEAITELEKAIREKDEEERETKEEIEQRERDYWEVQGAKTGFVKCF